MSLYRQAALSRALGPTAHLLHAVFVGPREMTDEEAESALAGCLVLAEVVDIARMWAKAHSKA